ncbi:MAG: ABC transporter ATP-binding protein [Bacteroidales bacterium]|nr:ABC transporter ATP-binding protein [Bacteroidales bacterium]
MLTINNLHVEVQDNEVLKSVNLEIPDGEVHALFGPNGSGKSVLIMTIMGYPEYKVTEGSILIDNKDILELDINERVKLGVGLSEQRPPTIKGVKLKNLLELIEHKDKKGQLYVNDMIEKFNIRKFLDRNINDGLSGGEIKQSELFLLLISNPKLLILDEPDSGVDPEKLKKIGGMINESLRDKRFEKRLPSNHLNRNSGLIATHSAAILDYIHVDKAHVMINGEIKCYGNANILMDQIKENGYEYCINCQHKNNM